MSAAWNTNNITPHQCTKESCAENTTKNELQYEVTVPGSVAVVLTEVLIGH